MATITGRHFVSFYTSYENIIVIDDQGNKYYLSPKELEYLLYEKGFNITKKKSRTWLTTIKTYNNETN